MRVDRLFGKFFFGIWEFCCGLQRDILFGSRSRVPVESSDQVGSDWNCNVEKWSTWTEHHISLSRNLRIVFHCTRISSMHNTSSQPSDIRSSSQILPWYPPLHKKPHLAPMPPKCQKLCSLLSTQIIPQVHAYSHMPKPTHCPVVVHSPEEERSLW